MVNEDFFYSFTLAPADGCAVVNVKTDKDGLVSTVPDDKIRLSSGSGKIQDRVRRSSDLLNFAGRGLNWALEGFTSSIRFEHVAGLDTRMVLSGTDAKASTFDSIR